MTQSTLGTGNRSSSLSRTQGDTDHRSSSRNGGASRILEREEKRERDSETIVVREGIVFQVHMRVCCFVSKPFPYNMSAQEYILFYLAYAVLALWF